MPAVRRNHRAEARAAVERSGPGPVGTAREMPLCGHADVWSWDETTPLVCRCCHPKPGTSPPRSAPPDAGPLVTSRLTPSPWRDDYR